MFRSVTVKTKIYGMAATLMTIGAIIAMTGWIGIHGLKASLGQYADASNKALDTVGIERDVVSFRGRSFNYLVTGSAEDGKRVREYFVTLPKLMDELVADNASPMLAPIAEATRGKFNEYLATLQSVLDLSTSSGPQAALAAYQSRVDVVARELSPLFTDLRTKRLAILEEIRTESIATYQRTVMLILSVSAVGLIAAILLALAIARSIIRPLNQITVTMTRLANGEAPIDVPESTGQDEISQMSRAVGVFAANADTIAAMTKAEQTTQEIGDIISRAAAGDLTVRVSVDGKTGFLLSIGQEVNRLLESTHRAFRDFTEKARSTAVSVTEASSAVGQVSDGARSQNGQLAQVAVALGESSVAIGEVSEGTRTASDKAVMASRSVEKGLASVDRLTTIMQSIAQNGRKVSQLTQVIGEIANRTHILSLNAAIEAARAGEHGKGFVVVAQEVGKLAESAGQNAKQIAEIVEQAAIDAAEGKVATDDVKMTMNSISDGTAETKNVIHSVAVAIEEQQATIKRIDGSVSELRTIAASNSAAAEEISATMVHLAGLADETRSQISRFKTA
jgi:methyl-accepting chemotaxis protein